MPGFENSRTPPPSKPSGEQIGIDQPELARLLIQPKFKGKAAFHDAVGDWRSLGLRLLQPGLGCMRPLVQDIFASLCPQSQLYIHLSGSSGNLGRHESIKINGLIRLFLGPPIVWKSPHLCRSQSLSPQPRRQNNNDLLAEADTCDRLQCHSNWEE